MNSDTVASFWQLYRRLPKAVRQQGRDAYRRFQSNPAHPSLHFHRLASYPEPWSVRVTRDYRAAGRYLKVIYKAGEEKGELFVITAYELKGKTRKAFRRRQRRRKP